MCKLFVGLAVVFLMCAFVGAHTYHGGRCPTIEPVQGFDMNRFLGMWFAVEKTKTDSSCLTYNISAGDEPGKFLVDQVSHNKLFEFYRYTGKITVPDTKKAGMMRVKFPLNILGSSSFIVYATDYTNYAGIFTCQNLGLLHRLSTTILSRRSTLDREDLRKLHEFLAAHDIDITDLSTIDHNTCFEDRPHTNGEVHHIYTESGENVNENAEVIEAGGVPNLDHDAEWIRL